MAETVLAGPEAGTTAGRRPSTPERRPMAEETLPTPPRSPISGAPKVIGGDFNVLATDVYKQVIG